MRAARWLGVMTVLLVAAVQTGCRKKMAPPDDLSRRATDALRERCTRAGARTEPSMGVHAVVEEEAVRDGSHIVGVRFEVAPGGDVLPELSFGSVGVGTSAEDARTTAGQEWLVLFGDPYCAARAAAPDGIRVGDFVAYPSVLGVRGERPGGWLQEDGTRNRRVLDAVAPMLAPRRPGEIGLLDLKVAVHDGQRPGGECRINGSLDVAACERIISMPWPAGAYMYKQTFAYKAAPP